MWFERGIRVLGQWLAYIGVLALLAFTGIMGVTRFPSLHGKRTFYLHSPSSQAIRTQTLSLQDFGKLTGESVEVAEGSATELLESLGAILLYIEEVGEVRSYYGFSAELGEGVQIGEHYVNLHIVEREKGCVVGSPIIFGGF